jgi:hypothetical protein
MCLGSKIKRSEICELGGCNQFVIFLSLKITLQTKLMAVCGVGCWNVLLT